MPLSLPLIGDLPNRTEVPRTCVTLKQSWCTGMVDSRHLSPCRSEPAESTLWTPGDKADLVPQSGQTSLRHALLLYTSHTMLFRCFDCPYKHTLASTQQRRSITVPSPSHALATLPFALQPSPRKPPSPRTHLHSPSDSPRAGLPARYSTPYVLTNRALTADVRCERLCEGTKRTDVPFRSCSFSCLLMPRGARRSSLRGFVVVCGGVVVVCEVGQVYLRLSLQPLMDLKERRMSWMMVEELRRRSVRLQGVARSR